MKKNFVLFHYLTSYCSKSALLFFLELALMSRFDRLSKFFTLLVTSMHKLKLIHILFQNLALLKFFNKKTAQILKFQAYIKGIEYY